MTSKDRHSGSKLGRLPEASWPIGREGGLETGASNKTPRLRQVCASFLLRNSGGGWRGRDETRQEMKTLQLPNSSSHVKCQGRV
jgi:hypothetical protein